MLHLVQPQLLLLLVQDQLFPLQLVLQLLPLPLEGTDPLVPFLLDFEPLSFQLFDFFFELVDGVLVDFFGGGLFVLYFGLNFLDFFFLGDVGFV